MHWLTVATLIAASPSMALSHPSISTADSTSAISNRIILIRHAEKGFTPDQVSGSTSVEPEKRLWPPWEPPRRGPPGGGGNEGGPPRGKFPNGLSDKGRERAQFLRSYFGNESEYDIGLIFAAPRDEDVIDTERTYATVLPLSRDLGLDIDISCANAEPECIANVVRGFAKTSDADILICWKHFFLNGIATALGATNAHSTYPDDRNDVVWIMQGSRIVEKRSQHYPGLDDGRVDEGDPDLIIEGDTQWGIIMFVSWFLSLFRWL